MQRCCEQNIKLNRNKVKLWCKEVPFLCPLISKDRLKADLAKIKAVLEMPTPTDVASVRQFIGFKNYLSKVLPHLSDVCESLWKLILPDVGCVCQGREISDSGIAASRSLLVDTVNP